MSLRDWFRRKHKQATESAAADRTFGRGKWREIKEGCTYAKAGEAVTCEDGHVICTLQRTVRVGEGFDQKAFGNWQQVEPMLGEVKNCTVCGKPWFQGMGSTLHFHDGWRVVLDGWKRPRQGGRRIN